MRRFRLLLVALAFTVGTVAARAPAGGGGGEALRRGASCPRRAWPGGSRSATPRWLANLLWLRAVQYIGEPRGDERGWDKLFPLLDTITDLDPGHGYAYQVGGVVLGSVGRTAESNAILEKGTRSVPDRYILPYLRAFNAFYYDDDWAAAGRFAEISARTPGAPPHVRQNVLTYYVKGKRADAAVAFLEQSLAEAKDPDTRKAVEGQLAQARLEQAVARLDDAADDWRRRYLAGPLALRQLVDGGARARGPARPGRRRALRRTRTAGSGRRRSRSASGARSAPATSLPNPPSAPPRRARALHETGPLHRPRHLPRGGPPQGPGEPAPLRRAPHPGRLPGREPHHRRLAPHRLRRGALRHAAHRHPGRRLRRARTWSPATSSGACSSRWWRSRSRAPSTWWGATSGSPPSSS